jgi:hypothetical protein
VPGPFSARDRFVSGQRRPSERRLRPAGAGFVAVSPAGRLRCASRGVGARQNSLRACGAMLGQLARVSSRSAPGAPPLDASPDGTQPPLAGDGQAVGTNTVRRIVLEEFGIGGPSRPHQCPRPAGRLGSVLDANGGVALQSFVDDCFPAHCRLREPRPGWITAVRLRCVAEILVTLAIGRKRPTADVGPDGLSTPKPTFGALSWSTPAGRWHGPLRCSPTKRGSAACRAARGRAR